MSMYHEISVPQKQSYKTHNLVQSKKTRLNPKGTASKIYFKLDNVEKEDLTLQLSKLVLSLSV